MMSSVGESGDGGGGGYILDYAKQVDIGIVDGEVNKHHPGTTVQPKIFLREKTNTLKFTSLLRTKITN